MLSLTRNINESIIIHTTDGPIEVVVRQVNGKQVRVGVIAPRHVNIARKEICRTQIQQETASHE